MQAIILSIGDELASGLTVNTNSSWLAERLTGIGIPTIEHITVGDDLTRIVSAIRNAGEALELARGGVMLITGGLGPTEDDLTRKALADALQESLVEDPDAVLQIENWFKLRQRVMSTSNRLQALRPHSARVLENLAGTAPGLWATHGRTDIFVMPGVPGEMRVMFERWILPALQERLAEDGVPSARGVTRVTTINTFGMGESLLGERIKDLMARGTNPLVGTTVHEGVVSVRIYATGTPEEAEAMTQQIRKAVHERLGAVIFGENEERLESAVGRLLQEQRTTLATAESFTGGMLSALLTDLPGSSACFMRGWVTYANSAKTEELGVPAALIAEKGAVSEGVARAMAEGARRVAGTDWGLSSTGIAGPDGGSMEKPVGTAWIGLAGPKGTEARRFIFPGDRRAVRLRGSQMALALLRWKLLGIEAPV